MVLAKKSLILVYAYAFFCKETLKKHKNKQTRKHTHTNTTLDYTSICKACYDENMIDTCNIYRSIPPSKKCNFSRRQLETRPCILFAANWFRFCRQHRQTDRSEYFRLQSWATVLLNAKHIYDQQIVVIDVINPMNKFWNICMFSRSLHQTFDAGWLPHHADDTCVW